MNTRIDRRPYDIFLSHAHVDAEFAAAVHRWPVAAGFRVWFDARAMAASDQINQALEEGIRSSRALIVLASAAAVDKGWVQHELGVAHDERNRDRSFAWSRSASAMPISAVSARASAS